MKHVRQLLLVRRFASVGLNFHFDPNGFYTYRSIFVGDNVNLGLRPILMASRSTIVIGNNVMFGPEVTVRGGNHRIDIVGTPMIQVTDQMKRAEDDPGVIIEDDVWVGTRAIILAGVVVGRGSVVAGGAVVTRNVQPYTIIGGNPARRISDRFTLAEALRHEIALYPEALRLSPSDLTHLSQDESDRFDRTKSPATTEG